ncbi:MAG: ATP-binding protein [Anaerolineae bacterium]|nr:ATP-binding protein [Anaerolineae bacterium]
MAHNPAEPDPNDIDGWLKTGGRAAVPLALATPAAKRLGVVVGGSISRGLAVKLDPMVNIEDLAVGRYVVVHGEQKRFFCMLNDISLNATNPAIQSEPPDISDPFLAEIYLGTVAYSVINVTPMLVIDEASGALPVKTIPGHFARVYTATEDDVNAVFGSEGQENFNVGSPLELQDTRIHLNLRRLVERSIGVFGKSGTGKSFLTRVLMAGIIKSNVGVSLIFDMHNDYGWEIVSEGEKTVKGLKQLFGEKVSILTLDEESSRRRNARYDFAVRLGWDEIEPEDIAMLKASLNLSDTMVDAAYTLHKLWGKTWINQLIAGTAEDLEYITGHTNIGGGTLAALQRRVERFQRWHFLVKENVDDSVQKIIDLLVTDQKSVVLEFGRYGTQLEAYMLVANYLTRRIHQRYTELVEKSLGDKGMSPPQLLITIEEAHKFLEPQVARQTTFGIIAREMRKYNVTLLVVDQRPSAIDEEVMSQIGTRVTALLDNERDINAVLNGISGAAGLREVLARLETKQQAIIMGHAVPMPVVIKPRTYDNDFYNAIMGPGPGLAPVATEQARKSLGSGGQRRI